LKSVPVAAVALIDPDKRVLLAQRPAHKAMGGLWEFPGGKIELGETPEHALIRELKEELGIEVGESCLLPLSFVSHTYWETLPPPPKPGECPRDDSHFIPASQMGLKEPFHLTMLLFACRNWRGIPRPHEGQTLKWIRSTELGTLPMPPADIPFIQLLKEYV